MSRVTNGMNPMPRPLLFATFVCALGVLAAATTSLAQLTPSAPGLELVGQIGGSTGRAFATGNRTFVQIGPWLRVLDTTTGEPVEIARGTSIGNLLAARPDVVFAARAHVLLALSFADPAAPIEVGRIELGAAIQTASLWGTGRLIVATLGGTKLVDAFHPAAMTLLGDMPGITGTVAAEGDRGYVAQWGPTRDRIAYPGTLHVLDLTTPAAPTVLGTMPITGTVTAHTAAHFNLLAARSGYLFAGSDDSGPAGNVGLRIVDVRNPAAPRQIAALPTLGRATGLALDGDDIYLAAGRTYLIDGSDPSAPRVVREAEGASQTGLAIAGERLVVSGQGVQVLSRPDLALLGSFEEPIHARSLAVSGSTALVIDMLAGLWSLDLSSPEAPRALDNVVVEGYAEDIAVDGTVAYIASELAGLRVIDFADPSALVEIGSAELGGRGRQVAVQGGMAVVGDSLPGLRVFDVGDPRQPVLIGERELDESPSEIAFVAPALAAICQGDQPLQFVDLADPANPVVAGALDLGGYCAAMVLWRGHLIVAGSTGGSGWVRFVDTTDIRAPRFGAAMGFAYGVGDVGLIGDHLLVPIAGNGMRVLELQEPGMMRQRADLADFPSLEPFAALSNEYMVSSQWSDGVYVFRFDAAALPTPGGTATAGPIGATNTPTPANTPDPGFVREPLLLPAVMNQSN